MLASRHHNKCRKLRQSIRATSTLKHSSNQKGFEARATNRRAVPATSSKKIVSQRAERAESDRKGEAPAFWFTGASGGGMLRATDQAISDDTMHRDFSECAHFSYGA